MNVVILNRQNVLRLRTARIRDIVAYFLGRARNRRRETWAEVILVLTDDNGIRQVNRLHLNHDCATDVITYAYRPLPGEQRRRTCGEVFVNAEQAFRVGPLYGGVARELALYMAHGCDHLAGASDLTLTERRKMRRRELGWLQDAREHLPGALEFLVEPGRTGRNRARTAKGVLG